MARRRRMCSRACGTDGAPRGYLRAGPVHVLRNPDSLPDLKRSLRPEWLWQRATADRGRSLKNAAVAMHVVPSKFIALRRYRAIRGKAKIKGGRRRRRALFRIRQGRFASTSLMRGAMDRIDIRPFHMSGAQLIRASAPLCAGRRSAAIQGCRSRARSGAFASASPKSSPRFNPSRLATASSAAASTSRVCQPSAVAA
ncbi:hypothetical protein AWB81_06679 [Caballeronia arationis]|nr:hypothetical protein AWB81_06679 [Caballeronia arationis]